MAEIGGFEPPSTGRKPAMLGHYTMTPQYFCLCVSAWEHRHNDYDLRQIFLIFVHLIPPSAWFSWSLNFLRIPKSDCSLVVFINNYLLNYFFIVCVNFCLLFSVVFELFHVFLYITHSDRLYKGLVSPHICLITFWFCHHLTNQGRPCDNRSFHKWNYNSQNVGLLRLRSRRTFNPPILWLQLPFALLLGFHHFGWMPFPCLDLE